MRFAEGPSTQVETTINAPVERVWTLVTDIALLARFSDELQSAEWLDDSRRPRVGARFVGRSAHPAIGTWRTTSTIVRADPPRCFAWAVGDPGEPGATWCFELTPVDTTTTQVRQSVRIGPGWSFLRDRITAQPAAEERILAVRLAELTRNMQATVEGIKALLDQR